MRKKIERYLLFIIVVFGSVFMLNSFRISRADSGWDSSYDSGSSSSVSSSSSSSSSSTSSSDSNSGSGSHMIDLDKLKSLKFIEILEVVSIFIFLTYIYLLFRSRKLRSYRIFRVGIVFTCSYITGLLSYEGNYSSKNIILNTFVGALIGLLIFILWEVVIYLKNNYYRNDKKNFTRLKVEKQKVKYLSDDEIKAIVGDQFDVNMFKKQLFNLYVSIQYAWMNFDFSTLRKLLTDEMFNMYKAQLDALKIKKQQNIIEDFSLIEVGIVNIKYVNGIQEIESRLVVKCLDYVVDENSNVVRGNKSKINKCYYDIVVVSGDKTINKCPNCGAPIGDEASIKCKSCGSYIVKNSKKYVMSKKKMTYQE